MKAFFYDTVMDLYENFSDVFLRIIVMILIMVCGLVIGWVFKKVVQKVLMLFRFDKWAADHGIITFLERGAVTSPPSTIISKIVFWIVIITCLSYSLNFAGMTQFTEYASRISDALPFVIVSMIIVILGIILSTFISRVIFMTCENANIGYGDVIAKSVRILLIIITFGIVFEYLGVGSKIITTSFLIIFGGIVMTLSLALGIGLSNVIASIIKERLKSSGFKKKDLGEE
jgi:hypothetical protein